MEQVRDRLGVIRTLLAEWREMGWVGKAALVGILASVAIAIGLGFSIPASARNHLLQARGFVEFMESRRL